MALTTALAGTLVAVTAAGGSSPGDPGRPVHCSLAGASARRAGCRCWGPEAGLGVLRHRRTVGHIQSVQTTRAVLEKEQSRELP